MEDNVRNELLENGRIHTFLRSGTNRVATKPDNVDLSVVSSRSKLRQRDLKEQHAFVSQSHHSTTYTTEKSEETKTFSSNSDIYTENGLSTSKNIQMLASGHIPNNLPNHKQIDQSSDVGDSKCSTRKSAYLFYKAAGEWWNVFPKTDYTYSKSSTCRKEIAPGVMTMPNMSRSPLHSYWGRKSVERSEGLRHTTLNKSSEDYSDETYNVSNTTYSTVRTVRTSLFVRIMTTIWHTLTAISSILTLKKYRLGFESTPVRGRGGHVEKSRYHRLEVLCYQSACYFLLLDTWILSLFHRSHYPGRQQIDKRRHSKYLFLLLILPLLFLGLWCNSASTSPVAALSSLMSGMVNLLPSSSVQKTSTSDVISHAHLTSEDGNMELLIQKILSSSEFKEILLMQDFRSKEQQLQNGETVVASVKLEQERLKMQLGRENQELDLALAEQKNILVEQQVTNERLTLEYSALKDRIEQLKIQMKSLQVHSLHLSRRVGNCRKIIIQNVPRVEIEQHVTNFLTGLFDTMGEGQSNNPENIKNWIKTLLMAKENLEERLADTMTVVDERITEATGKSAEIVMASVSDMIRQEFLKQEAKLHADGINYVSVTRESVSGDPCDGCSLSIDKVEEIVNRALHLYDADKTGMVDYALESAGGTVINIRCTENFNERSLALAFLGMTFPWSSNHPRIALQPDVHPGRCWAFRGAQGYLVIRLAKIIKVSAFSIEHIPVSISHAGNIDAAPKNFSVWGLNNETDREPVLLGKYMYDTTGPPLQTFPVQNNEAPPYQIVELVIESNHGNLEYTCLYRFRVHGIAV